MRERERKREKEREDAAGVCIIPISKPEKNQPGNCAALLSATELNEGPIEKIFFAPSAFDLTATISF